MSENETDTASRLVIDERSKARAYLLERQQAYRQVFNPDSKPVKLVLLDLKRFCRESTSCFDPDPRIHAVFEGRREVILRIREHISLSPDELLTLYGGNNE